MSNGQKAQKEKLVLAVELDKMMKTQWSLFGNTVVAFSLRQSQIYQVVKFWPGFDGSLELKFFREKFGLVRIYQDNIFNFY